MVEGQNNNLNNSGNASPNSDEVNKNQILPKNGQNGFVVPQSDQKAETDDLEKVDENLPEDSEIEFGYDVSGSAQNSDKQKQDEMLAQIRKEQEAARKAEETAAKTPAEQAGIIPEAAVGPGPRRLDGVANRPQPAEQAQPAEPTGQPTGQIKQPAIKNPAEQAQDKAADAAKDQATKAASKFTKEAILTFLKSLVASPYFWIIMGIILLLLIAFGLFAYFYGSANSGANGKTPTQVTSSASNKSLLDKLQILSGNSDLQESLSKEMMKSIQENLTSLKDQVSDQTIKNKIDTALKAVQTYLTTPSTDNGNTVITQLKTVLNDIANSVIPTMQGRYPVDKNTIANFNSDLHNNVPLNTNSNSDSHGTYIYNGQNKCDAVDLYLNTEVTDVFPVFTGTINDISDDGSGIDGTKKIVIKNGDYTVLYAFVAPDSSLKIGDQITDTNKKIGQTVQGKIHLELAYKDACLTTSVIDQIDKNSSSPSHTTWGEYLWTRMKTVLKLN